MGDIIDTKQEYLKELEDIRWHKKREKILVLCKYKCTICNTSINLHVHHNYYIVGHKAWEYPNKALTVLCSKCHRKWHKKNELLVLEKVFRKRKPYAAPLKRSSSKRLKKAPKVKISKRQRDLLAKRDRAKRKLIKSYGFVAKEGVKMFNETKGMTIVELKIYLKNKKSI